MAPRSVMSKSESSLAERVALAVFAAFTAVAVIGFATFGRNPELLVGSPAAQLVYAKAFTFFPQVQVLLAFAALAVALVIRARWRWLLAAGAVYAVSFASELAGTTVGLPFGAYRYTDALGAKWLGHVPVLIPLSWFTMALPSYLLAAAAMAGRDGARAGWRGRLPAMLGGSFVLLAWDLALDPAMSWVTKYWVWGEVGPYYGMPLLNLFGWYVTGLALMAVLAWAGADRWGAGLPWRWTAAYYGVNLLMPLGMVAAAGHWGAVFTTAVALAGSFGVFRLVPARRPAVRYGVFGRRRAA